MDIKERMDRAHHNGKFRFRITVEGFVCFTEPFTYWGALGYWEAGELGTYNPVMQFQSSSAYLPGSYPWEYV